MNSSMLPKPPPLTLLLFIPFFLFSLKTFSQSDEKQILLNLKNYWGDPPSLSSWKPAGDHCKWAGIRCTASGSVSSIILSYANIDAPIPPSICNLRTLSLINLSNNNIPGRFPIVLYNCSSLQQLIINNNYFDGEIPADIDKMSQNLTHLILSGNNFIGDIPPAIGRLPAIKSIHLSYNLFNGTIPAEIGNLSSLEDLWLAHNPFPPTKIPPEFGNLTSITYLWMSKMNLVGKIPETMGKLENLEHLDLSMNSLVGDIPASIWMVKQLKILYLYDNNLTGEISKSIAARSLVEIDLSMNQLTGSIPEVIGKIETLELLFLYFNNLSGEVPANFAKLPKLYDIRLFNNRLEGVLPPEMGKYSQLWNFEVNDNQFTGEVPEHICDGKALTCLIVFNNKLTGKLPESLGSCGTLLNVQIQNNTFTGEFPAGIWSAVNLSQVFANHNSLTGTLPERLPWNLTQLEIQSNQFYGKIPSAAGRLSVFYGDDNNFSGKLPMSFTEMPLLQYLTLSRNQISGELPAAIGSLKSLSILNLRGNLISGPIPKTIGSIPVLNVLDLSQNDLSGEIPSDLVGLKLSTLNLSSNDLTGEIPVPLLAYDRGFLSNPGLCASHSIANIRSCSYPSNRSDKLSTGLLVLFSILGVLLFIGVLALGILITRECLRRKRTCADPLNLKLTSFHAVDFSQSGIMKGVKEENLIGSGGGGKVYSVSLGQEIVAVKKIWNARKLDSTLEKEFQAEMAILGSIRHDNIVKLLCCISSENSKLLVYQYLENGSLDRWLHRRRRGNFPPLDWPTRLQIAIGAARGLSYMHHDCFPPIVHRDVKSSNILLDPEFKAKIADFGLARILVRGGEPETVSAIAGSFGYMAPECSTLRKVNEKVDVYSFGVVLLELATGREAGDGGDEEDNNLTDWAWRRYKERGGAVTEALDEDIAAESPEYLAEVEMVFRMGLICTGWEPVYRPTMKDVLQMLMKLGHGQKGSWAADGECGGGRGTPLLESKSQRGSRRKKIADIMEDSDDSGVARYAGIDSLL